MTDMAHIPAFLVARFIGLGTYSKPPVELRSTVQAETRTRLACTVCLVANFFHLNQTTIERGAAPLVGEALGSQHVHRISVRRQLWRANRGDAYNAARDGWRNLGA